MALALALVLSLVLVALAAQARPAQTTFPGQNGPIAYYAYDSSSRAYQIYTAPSTPGGSPKQLTTDSTDHYEPDWGSAQQ